MHQTKNYTAIRLIFLFLSGLMLLFIVAPLLGLFFSTSVPSLFESLQDRQVTSSIGLTLCVSALFTLLAGIFALPLAYLIARKDFRGKTIVQGLIDIPIVLPHSAAGIAVLGFISRDSTLGRFADLLGFNLVGSPFAIGIAMAFVSVPFLINAARDGFLAVPERLEQAARSLGASPFKVFRHISLPLARHSVITGLVMMFARGMSEFGAVVIVAYHPMTTPVLIFDRFNSYGLDYARPVAVLFIIICIVVFIALRLLGKKKNGG
ncbi:MAG: ABC transporter permease [Bacteroidales bacterium]|jgi:molybdate/tungstate transport system permease protein|nr:ABC transporter permease [Bacteroidales bacterium]MDD2264240.1 ABC transporter permease [Bacteroidales bacterium]MDD2831474.1 ABC transporter permease [Bacteroidales bacterium]MDD3208468.1 ABC transporter permease [Bacteroidales bacterium]MDD3697119.1 ABC transporter permease [Bacteroidales bacterium]